jgi:hypothetical protein
MKTNQINPVFHEALKSVVPITNKWDLTIEGAFDQWWSQHVGAIRHTHMMAFIDGHIRGQEISAQDVFSALKAGQFETNPHRSEILDTEGGR